MRRMEFKNSNVIMMIVNTDSSDLSTESEKWHRLNFVENDQKNVMIGIVKANKNPEHAGLQSFNSEAFGANVSAGLFSWQLETRELLTVATFVASIVFYVLSRRAKCRDDVNAIVLSDVVALLSKIEELSGGIKLHQSGVPCAGRDLGRSREHLSELRIEAVNILNRITEAINSKQESDSLKEEFHLWKRATEGDSGWITDKRRRWSPDRIEALEESNRAYIVKITKLRQRIAKKKLKL